MKQMLAALACAVLAACGSAGGSASAEKLGVPAPQVELVQLVGPEELNWTPGMIEMKYALRVANPGTEPITLRQIKLQSPEDQGPYWVPASSYFFREAIAPGAERRIEFFAKAITDGNRYSIDAQSPVAIRTVAYFDAPKGNFRKVFTAYLTQSFQNDH